MTVYRRSYGHVYTALDLLTSFGSPSTRDGGETRTRSEAICVFTKGNNKWLCSAKITFTDINHSGFIIFGFYVALRPRRRDDLLGTGIIIFAACAHKYPRSDTVTFGAAKHARAHAPYLVTHTHTHTHTLTRVHTHVHINTHQWRTMQHKHTHS